jgi:hypothetical protein
MINRFRYDCILIWGHGMKYFHEILKEIEQNENFLIVKIVKHIPTSQNKIVREVYSYDYAPFNHLKDKTKYLKKVSKEVCFIFIKNNDPQEEYFGTGFFRHVESKRLKTFKEAVRDIYNPRINGERSHDHVIHATDNQMQTHYLLKYLGYKKGIRIFENENYFNMPYFVKKSNEYIIKKIPINCLYSNIVFGDSWNKYKISKVKITESPHFAAAKGNMNDYRDYWNKFIGGPIQAYNTPEKFQSLISNFNYLAEPHDNSFIVVTKNDDYYNILDGNHRAAIHASKGFSTIMSCIIP